MIIFRVKDELREQHCSHDDFPAFLWPDNQYNPNEPFSTFLRNELLVQVS